ncbi:MAG TPA: cob(I)yrinic acid a,c-diamide adenosyltransferase [Acidimicrobiia bacterium]|nr:cob(I)yrinic acid a,c-diamide adenosyltransferase [Acidimicrobiia bacterium]
MKVYTRTGDDGTTGLYFGGRVRKDHPQPRAFGAVDEAQAALGVVRAFSTSPVLAELMIEIERDLYIAMAELATLPDNRHKLSPGVSAVTAAMVSRLEQQIDRYAALFDPPDEFVIPGGHPVAALLDVARTAMRRAEREALAVAAPGSEVVRYLNRLSDLLWVLARWQEGKSVPAKETEERT